MDQSPPFVLEWACENPSWCVVGCLIHIQIIYLHSYQCNCTTLELASDTILYGKAKVMAAGGFGDISEEGSYEFANMKATNNAETEFAMGRPTEMSRPATTSRAGVRSHYKVYLIKLLTLDPSSWHLGPLCLHSLVWYRCAYCHECNDGARVRRPDSWYPGIYVNFYIRIYRFQEMPHSHHYSLAIKPDALFLVGEHLEIILFLSLMFHIVRGNLPSGVARSMVIA